MEKPKSPFLHQSIAQMGDSIKKERTLLEAASKEGKVTDDPVTLCSTREISIARTDGNVSSSRFAKNNPDASK